MSFYANKMSKNSGISIPLDVVTLSKWNFSYIGETISEAADFKEGAAYRKVRTHTFEVFYSQNYNTCEGSL